MSRSDRAVPKTRRQEAAERRLAKQVREAMYDAMARTGVTQTQIADRVGVTRSVISQALLGYRPDMCLSTAALIFDAIGVEPEIATYKRRRR